MAAKIKYEDERKQKAHDAVDLAAMQRELALTEDRASRLGSPIVWSHNDLLSGNVLVSKQVPIHTHRIFSDKSNTADILKACRLPFCGSACS